MMKQSHEEVNWVAGISLVGQIAAAAAGVQFVPSDGREATQECLRYRRQYRSRLRDCTAACAEGIQSFDGFAHWVACSQCLGSRSVERGNAAIASIKKILPHAKLECVELDLDSLDDTLKTAAAVKVLAPALHVLVLNAGLLAMRDRETTKDGFERCIGVNHLGHFLLTLALVDVLQAAAPSRVVVVSSITHSNVIVFDWDDLLLTKSRAWTRAKAYAQSKLANVLFAYELNRRFSHIGIYANALEPGLVASDILRDASNGFIRVVGTWILRIFGRNTAAAAYTSVYVASDPSLERVGGKFFQPHWSKCREILSSNESYDEFVATRLWDESVKLVALEKRLGKALPAKITPPSLRGKPRGWHYVWIGVAAAVALVAVVLGLLVFRLV